MSRFIPLTVLLVLFGSLLGCKKPTEKAVAREGASMRYPAQKDAKRIQQ